ncbi:MAG: LPS assembly protein LptD [Pseudomonadota bacterium]
MLSNLLFALGATFSVAAQPAEEARSASDPDDVVLTADRVYREVVGGPLIAEGDVRAIQGAQFLRADRVIYDIDADTITAEGNVAVRDETGSLYFAERAELSSDFKNGLIETFEAELGVQGTLAAATAIRRDTGRNELRRGAFTLCNVCDEGFRRDRPVWQVKARKVTQVEEAQVMRFQNAFVEVLGIPLVYIPWIQVPDPTAKRKSGLLAPQIGSSTRAGVEIEVPYYQVISDYQDVTFAPRHMTDLGTLLKGEWRRNTHNSSAVVQAGYINPTNDLSQEPGDPGNARWHVFSKYTRELEGDWNFLADIDAVSDKGYLRTYEIEPVGALRENIGIARPDRLESVVSFDRQLENSSMDVSAIHFQTLRLGRAEEDQDFTADALPRVRHQHRFNLLGGELETNNSFLVLNRDAGLDTFRVSSGAEYNATRMTRGGHRFEVYGALRADGYLYRNATAGIQACNIEDNANRFATCREELPNDLEDDRFETFRVLPTIGADWSYPLARLGNGNSVIIEPRVQAVVSPNQTFTDEVFNEDSQFFQFDTVTLFDFSKSAGLDQWEDGQRLNVGVSAAAVIGSKFSVNGVIGTQFRASTSNAFLNDTGLGEKSADVVGAVDLRWDRYLSLDSRFRIDDDTGSFRRVETTGSTAVGPVFAGVTYLRTEADDVETTGLRDEFLTVNAGVRFNKNVSVAARQAQNLDSGDTTNTRFILRLQNNCAALSITYAFNDSTRDGFEQNRSVLVRVDVLGF